MTSNCSSGKYVKQIMTPTLKQLVNDYKVYLYTYMYVDEYQTVYMYIYVLHYYVYCFICLYCVISCRNLYQLHPQIFS